METIIGGFGLLLGRRGNERVVGEGDWEEDMREAMIYCVVDLASW